MKRIKFVGLDVHAETIAAAVAEQEGEVRSLGEISNREEGIDRAHRFDNHRPISRELRDSMLWSSALAGLAARCGAKPTVR